MLYRYVYTSWLTFLSCTVTSVLRLLISCKRKTQKRLISEPRPKPHPRGNSTTFICLPSDLWPCSWNVSSVAPTFWVLSESSCYLTYIIELIDRRPWKKKKKDGEIRFEQSVSFKIADLSVPQMRFAGSGRLQKVLNSLYGPFPLLSKVLNSDRGSGVRFHHDFTGGMSLSRTAHAQ